jgi:hypothetical protein
MEPLEVVARFDLQGKIIPLRITLRGQELMVESTGRRWDSAQGEHILVITSDGRAHELCLDMIQRKWFLIRTSSDRFMA